LLLVRFELLLTASGTTHEGIHHRVNVPINIKVLQCRLDRQKTVTPSPDARKLARQREDALAFIGEIDPSTISNQRRQGSRVQKARNDLRGVVLDISRRRQLPLRIRR
jgi:hypothetical protein